MRGVVVLVTVATIGCAPAGARATGMRAPAVDETTFVAAPLGEVHLLRAGSRPRPLAVFVSGDGGWDDTADRLARELVRRRFTVAGVDIDALRDGMESQRLSCVDFSRVFSDLARDVRDRIPLAGGTASLLAGHSAGATAVYIALAQGERASFVGGISVSFAPEFEFPAPPCRSDRLPAAAKTGRDLYVLEPSPRSLAAPWTVVMGTADGIVSPEEALRFADRVPGALALHVEGAGHGLDDSDQTRRALDLAVNRTRPVHGRRGPGPGSRPTARENP